MREIAARFCLLSSAAVLASLGLSACSGHVPELVAVEYRLSLCPLDPSLKDIAEQLSVFAAVRDEDGYKDIAALHVLHDESEYIWTLRPETWTKKEQNRETWIGASGLTSPNSAPLPRGLYRVVLEDLAGDSDEISFTLGTGMETGAVFPAVHRNMDRVAVSSKYSRTELLFLDSEGKLLRVVEAPREYVSLDTLYGSGAWKQEAASLLAYAYDPQRNIGLYSWKQKTTP